MSVWLSASHSLPLSLFISLWFSLASLVCFCCALRKKSLIKFSSLFLASRIVCMRCLLANNNKDRKRARERAQQQQLRVLTAGRNLWRHLVQILTSCSPFFSQRLKRSSSSVWNMTCISILKQWTAHALLRLHSTCHACLLLFRGGQRKPWPFHVYELKGNFKKKSPLKSDTCSSKRIKARWDYIRY